MQKVKYFIFSILILFGLVLTGELYQSYMDVFNDFYSTTFYMQDEIPRDTMLSDIQNVAAKNHIQVFCMETEVENMFTKNITIYGNKNSIDTLKSDYYMHEGKIGSIFSDNTTVNCFDFFEIPDDMLLSEDNRTFYLIGEFSNAEQMKRELIDTYGGKFPKEDDGYSSLSEKKSTVIAVWCVITVLICFISFYTLTLNQQELMVRCTMGESKLLLFLKTILSDTIFLVLWFILAVTVLQKFSNVLFLSKYSITLFLICILLNIVVNCFLFTFKVRKAFSKISGQKALITGTYIVKTFSCLLTALILTFQAATIKESVSFYQQKNFFEEHKDYNYIRIHVKGNLFGVETNLYYKYADRMLILDPMYDFGEGEERKTAVFANEKAYDVLREWIPELDSLDTDADVCLIKHCDTEISESDISYLTNLNSFFGGEEPLVKIAEYQKKSKIIEVEDDFLNYSEWAKNPTIVLVKNNHGELLSDEEVYSGSLDIAPLLRSYNFMINAAADELKSFVEHYGCSATVTNVYEYYLYRWEVMKRSLYISLVFIVLILLLEIYISFMIIKLEYKINATELAVMKTLGYSNFERIKKLYLLTGICIGISFISSIIILYLIHQSAMVAPVIAVIWIALIEFPMIHRYSIKYEKKNVPEILKGGNV